MLFTPVFFESYVPVAQKTQFNCTTILIFDTVQLRDSIFENRKNIITKAPTSDSGISFQVGVTFRKRDIDVQKQYTHK